MAILDGSMSSSRLAMDAARPMPRSTTLQANRTGSRTRLQGAITEATTASRPTYSHAHMNPPLGGGSQQLQDER